MNTTSLYHISLLDLLWMMIPVGIVIATYIRWVGDRVTLFYALARMMLQLILIGYLLTYIFEMDSPYPILLVLSVMLVSAGIIAVRPLRRTNPLIYWHIFLSIFVGSVLTLLLVIFGVLEVDPWYAPRFVIPLAGMIFANAMNAVSIAAERFESELQRGTELVEARATAYKAALIPIINSLFAVGLVSLPGMMTGQILSGVDPLVAARYQMMVMLMILGSGGISVALYLILSERLNKSY